MELDSSTRTKFSNQQGWVELEHLARKFYQVRIAHYLIRARASRRFQVHYPILSRSKCDDDCSPIVLYSLTTAVELDRSGKKTFCMHSGPRVLWSKWHGQSPATCTPDKNDDVRCVFTTNNSIPWCRFLRNCRCIINKPRRRWISRLISSVW